MTYEQALEYIHGRPRLPSKGSLDRIHRLLILAGNPHRDLNFIHVTGTNGKGSASSMLAKALTLDGRRTGLFISPYILDFRERIQVDGEMIPKEELTSLLEEIMPFLDRLDKAGQPVSEFELDTVLALLWFKKQNCSAVVLEVGIGGRNDATNIIPKPLLSVIMGIGLDHQQLLGNTVAEIAANKAGIIKGNPTVVYPFQEPEAMAELMERCAHTGSALIQPNAKAAVIHNETLDGTDFSYGGHKYHLNLLGRYQVYNALTVIEGARVLNIRPSALEEALRTITFPVRLELMQTDPPLLLDGAHNFHGMRALVDSVTRLWTGRITAVVGMLADKDMPEALRELGLFTDHVIVTQVENTPRAADPEDIRALTVPHCRKVTLCPDFRKAVPLALQDGNLTIVCGSLYLASDVRRWITEENGLNA
ncbi:MAG: bifunctional folylpolyglutamate synthase/dihydrofolate synthase [Oscillospiraceae bacterium]|nr:bifunctional folylpolyglutamate synthase/dihydrofolate synthase [Oscillospiraceae bacterium]